MWRARRDDPAPREAVARAPGRGALYLPDHHARAERRLEAGTGTTVIEGKPSFTAQRVAEQRAAHQLLDRARVFEDALALRIVGRETEAALRANPERFSRGRFAARLRAFLAVRSRFAEESLAEAIARGARQYVILGAGLDTFAYRNGHPPGTLRVFEVDHPATQAWKRRRLEETGIAIPSDLRFVPIDFEAQALETELIRSGLDRGASTFFSWLGVTQYLESAAVIATLRTIASIAGIAGGVVFDYALHVDELSPLQRLVRLATAARVRAAGEPWRASFRPAELSAEMERIGFASATDVDPRALHRRYAGSAGETPTSASRARLMRGLMSADGSGEKH